MEETLNKLSAVIWGIPTLLLILGAGIYLTFGSRCFQITHLPKAIKDFFEKLRPGYKPIDGVSPWQALCTALAATVGTGNIAGVAGAITIGGPGAIFWMWICGFFGMILKCAEATLAIVFRTKNEAGEMVGGPMYLMERGLGSKWRPLALLYAFFGVVAAFGVGNATQINAVIGGLHGCADAFSVSIPPFFDYIVAGVLAISIGLMLSGGAKRVGKIAEMLVPFASLLYILLGVGVLFVRYTAIPNAFSQIFRGAFSPSAVTGGAVGSLFLVLKTGAARGVFTNEAGMGTASIAHAAAAVRHPAEQGLMGIMEVFLDTIVICTVTALVILCSGIGIPYGADSGATLTVAAFSEIYGGWVGIVITMCLILFALATVLGWGLYGLRCAQYLLGDKAFRWFIYVQMITVILTAVLKTDVVWLLAEIVNGLMAIPNLIALIGLSPQFFLYIHEFKLRSISSVGGTYENFNQCKSLRALSHAKIPSHGLAGGKRGEDHLSSEYRSA